MDFKVTSVEQKLLKSLSISLAFDIERMLSKGVLTIKTDSALKQIQDAAKLRSSVLTTLKCPHKSKEYLDLAKRIRGMRNELADSLKTAQKDLA